MLIPDEWQSRRKLGQNSAYRSSLLINLEDLPPARHSALKADIHSERSGEGSAP